MDQPWVQLKVVGQFQKACQPPLVRKASMGLMLSSFHQVPGSFSRA